MSESWLDGEFSVGDVAVASVLKTLDYTGWQLDASAYPRLSAWFARVGARPGWQKAAAQEKAIFEGAGL